MKLRDIAKVSGGKRLPKGETLQDEANGHPYIRVADMGIGVVDTKNLKFVPENVVPSIEAYRIYKGEIYISVAGTLGLVGLIHDELNGANLTENANRISNIQINETYLCHFLNSSEIQNIIEETKTVGAQPKLALERIRNFTITHPSDKIEQQAIADALSDVDALITSLDKLIHKKQAIFDSVLSSLIEFSDGPLTRLSLGDGFQIKARIGWQGLTTNEYLDTGNYLLVTGTEFLDGTVDWDDCWCIEEKRYDQDKNIQLRVNDVLITKDGTIGKIAHVDSLTLPATLNSGVFVIRPTSAKVLPKYLFYVFRSNLFKIFLAELSAGSTINHLYQKDIVKFGFSLPSSNERQQEIVNILDEMSSEIRILTRQLKKEKQLKKAMMHELLTGRTRLI